MLWDLKKNNIKETAPHSLPPPAGTAPLAAAAALPATENSCSFCHHQNQLLLLLQHRQQQQGAICSWLCVISRKSKIIKLSFPHFENTFWGLCEVSVAMTCLSSISISWASGRGDAAARTPGLISFVLLVVNLVFLRVVVVDSSCSSYFLSSCSYCCSACSSSYCPSYCMNVV